MLKSEFRQILSNLQLLRAEAMDQYREVPLRIKMEILVDFLHDEEPAPFRLLCALLLRTILMEDFATAWNTITSRAKKLQFVEKIKLLLISDDEKIPMRQAAVHIASMILNSEVLDENAQLCFLDFIMTLVTSNIIHQENVLLLFLMIAHKMNKTYLWSFVEQFIEAITTIDGNRQRQMFGDCLVFAGICAWRLEADKNTLEDLFYTFMFLPISQMVFPNHNNMHWLLEENSCGDTDSANISLRKQCYVQYGIVDTGFPNLNIIQMELHVNMRNLGAKVDSKSSRLSQIYNLIGN